MKIKSIEIFTKFAFDLVVVAIGVVVVSVDGGVLVCEGGVGTVGTVGLSFDSGSTQSAMNKFKSY